MYIAPQVLLMTLESLKQNQSSWVVKIFSYIMAQYQLYFVLLEQNGLTLSWRSIELFTRDDIGLAQLVPLGIPTLS